MEQSNASSNLFELQIDQLSSSYLSETAKWTKFLSILGFIICGLIVLVGVFFGSIMGALFSGRLGGGAEIGSTPGLGAMGGILAIVYIIIALAYFFPCLYLFKFSSKMQIAIRNNDQGQLTDSFKNLKSCFKFLGIMTIIILSFYVLAFLIALIAGSSIR